VLSQSHGLPLAAIDIWVHDRPRRIFEAVAHEYDTAARG